MSKVIGMIIIMGTLLGFPIYMIYSMTKEFPEIRKEFIQGAYMALLLIGLVMLGTFFLVN